MPGMQDMLFVLNHSFSNPVIVTVHSVNRCQYKLRAFYLDLDHGWLVRWFEVNADVC